MLTSSVMAQTASQLNMGTSLQITWNAQLSTGHGYVLRKMSSNGSTTTSLVSNSAFTPAACARNKRMKKRKLSLHMRSTQQGGVQ